VVVIDRRRYGPHFRRSEMSPTALCDRLLARRCGFSPKGER
jgi:hypothetical protein